MQLRRGPWLFVGIILAWPTGSLNALAEDKLRVGVAEADITPPKGFPVAGYYHERLATGTTDPLKARALVIRGEKAQAAVVTCDLTGISMDLTAEVSRRASARTKIPAENIIITA